MNKSDNSQPVPGFDACSINSLKLDYYVMSLTGKYNKKRVFYTQAQAIDHVFSFFGLGYIDMRNVISLVTYILQMDIPLLDLPWEFNVHDQYIKETEERRSVVCKLVEAQTVHEVCKDGMARLAVNQFPDEKPEGYIRTRERRSSFFTTYNDGIGEVLQMRKDGYIGKIEQYRLQVAIDKVYQKNILPQEYYSLVFNEIA